MKMNVMRKWFYGLLICGGACLSASGAPRLVCEQPEFDFGKLNNSETVNHSFVIRNTGDEPLRITNVKACCGAAAIAKDSPVQPGMSTEIRVKSALLGRQGDQVRSVTIHSNDPDHPQFECRLTGVAVAAVYCDPGVINFGRISTGKNNSQTVRVVSADGTPVKVLQATSATGHFVAEILPADKSGTARVRVYASGSLPGSNIVERLEIETDHPQYSRLSLPVFACTGDDLNVLPKEIQITQAELSAAQPVMKSVLVRSASKQPFTVLKAEIPGAAAPMKISPMGSQGTRITWIGSKIDASWNSKKLVITVEQDGKQKTVEAPIRITS
jgi:hypothetical protein